MTMATASTCMFVCKGSWNTAGGQQRNASKKSGSKVECERRSPFPLFGRRVVGWLFGGESMLGWPRAINRRLSQPSAASLIYRAPPIAPGFIWPLSNTCSVTEPSPALAGPLCILNNPDGNCPFLKCKSHDGTVLHANLIRSL